jgi:DNA-binding NarL/FixJ family response regulator
MLVRNPLHPETRKRPVDEDAMSLRIVLVEADPAYLSQLEYLISKEKGYTVARRFETAQSLLEAAREISTLKPCGWDLILLSLCLPDSDGMRTTQQLRKLLPEVPIITYTLFETAQTLIRAMPPEPTD